MFEKFSKKVSFYKNKKDMENAVFSVKTQIFWKKRKKNVEFGMAIPSETFLVIFQHSERIQSKKRRTKCQDFS